MVVFLVQKIAGTPSSDLAFEANARIAAGDRLFAFFDNLGDLFFLILGEK